MLPTCETADCQSALLVPANPLQMSAIRFVGWTLAWLVALLWALWAFGALYFDFPLAAGRTAAAILFAAVLLAAIVFLRSNTRRLSVVLTGCVAVLSWWLTLKPSNNQDWQPDVAETAWAEVNGDSVTIHNVRNCDYRTETDYTPRWETRTINLSQIAGMDIAITYWGSPWMAHPIVTFRFADSRPLCFSIETRKRVGQEYSAVRGLYRQFALICIAADERDPIRLRTNYRKGEDVYLYRINASVDDARQRFLEYIETVNSLHATPRWYDAVTTNCTTAIRAQHPVNQRAPWDWRILVNGKGDELLYQRHLIATRGLPFAELKERSRINRHARQLDQDPDFSQHIREGPPGFAEP